MPFKTTEELKNFLAPVEWQCLKCKFKTNFAVEYDLHVAEHERKEQEEAERERMRQENAKPIPELKNILENT